jgi:D-glycero-alpha-D-manno-heptose 1-phosphate guanylyltransferase
MEAIILAGGLGTRLAPALGELPKALAPVAGRPFLDWLLQALAANGVTRCILSLGYKAEMVREHCGERCQGVELAYSIEETPLGTGGAIRRALPLVHEWPAFVLNGDTLAEIELAAMRRAHLAAGARISIAAASVPDASRYGLLRIAGGRVAEFQEKQGAEPGFINSGCYLFNHDLFDGLDLPERFSFERDFLAPRIGQLQPLVFAGHGYFIDIGVPEDLARAQRELVWPPEGAGQSGLVS